MVGKICKVDSMWTEYNGRYVKVLRRSYVSGRRWLCRFFGQGNEYGSVWFDTYELTPMVTLNRLL